MNIHERWNNVWKQIQPLTNGDALLADVIQRYSEPHRAYHTLGHVIHCLNEFDQVKSNLQFSDEVELAIWLHDIIYDTTRTDNEDQTAIWSENQLFHAGVNVNIITRVSDLIMATKHEFIPASADAQFLADIDLSILGGSHHVFDQYEMQVRKEYDWIPNSVYSQARANVLESFLNRNRIYFTQCFFNCYEAQARENLDRSLTSLYCCV